MKKLSTFLALTLAVTCLAAPVSAADDKSDALATFEAGIASPVDPFDPNLPIPDAFRRNSNIDFGINEIGFVMGSTPDPLKSYHPAVGTGIGMDPSTGLYHMKSSHSAGIDSAAWTAAEAMPETNDTEKAAKWATKLALMEADNTVAGYAVQDNTGSSTSAWNVKVKANQFETVGSSGNYGDGTWAETMQGFKLILTKFDTSPLDNPWTTETNKAAGRTTTLESSVTLYDDDLTNPVFWSAEDGKGLGLWCALYEGELIADNGVLPEGQAQGELVWTFSDTAPTP